MSRTMVRTLVVVLPQCSRHRILDLTGHDTDSEFARGAIWSDFAFGCDGRNRPATLESPRLWNVSVELKTVRGR